MRAFAVFLLLALVFSMPSIAPERTAVVFLSFDVEISPPTAVNGSLVSYEAVTVLPGLQKILGEQGIPATFFVTGDLVEKYPKAFLNLHNSGFELAAHGGYLHAGFKGIPLGEQKKRILVNVELIRNLTGAPPIGFRAPAHDYDNNTFAALRELGFRYDSSIVGNGSAPGLIELPVTVSGGQALNIDYLLRFHGLFYTEGLVNNALEAAKKSGRPLVIYAHPWAFTGLQNFPVDYKAGPRVLSDFEKFLVWLKGENVVFAEGADFVSGGFSCGVEPSYAVSL